MKLKIEKLGRIRSAEIDVRPLTVFIGPNNTNKTWTAYTLYGLLQFLSRTLTSAGFHASQGEAKETTEFSKQLKELMKPLFEALTADPAPTRVECSLAISQLFNQANQGFNTLIAAESLCTFLGIPTERLPDAFARLDSLRTEFATSIVSWILFLNAR